ncbi:MAG: hypothetical protein Q8P67_26370 [archaeon]|nr:hypothetical protein [archaeon]
MKNGKQNWYTRRPLLSRNRQRSRRSRTPIGWDSAASSQWPPSLKRFGDLFLRRPIDALIRLFGHAGWWRRRGGN